MSDNKLLELSNVFVEYNRFRALHGVDISCGEGEIIALLGPNGAGKSTLLKAAFGLVPVSEGTIKWRGNLISPSPAEMVRAGMSYTPQGKSVFPTLSVKENLETSVHFITNQKEIKKRAEEVIRLFPALQDKWNAEAGTLSGGQQQMVVLARGLMTRPSLLLLDEPSLGLSPKLVKDVFDKVLEINRAFGTSFIIVEHNLKSLLGIVKYAYVLKQGRVVSKGSTEDKSFSENIQNIYKL